MKRSEELLGRQSTAVQASPRFLGVLQRVLSCLNGLGVACERLHAMRLTGRHIHLTDRMASGYVKGRRMCLKVPSQRM